MILKKNSNGTDWEGDIMDRCKAGMAKLADAHASGACSRKGLGVQILFPAQKNGGLAEWSKARGC